MKFIGQVILIAILAYILDLFLPWYAIGIAAFVVSIFLNSFSNFLAGFLSIGLLWFFAAWLIDQHSSSDLASRVSQIFPFEKKTLLLVITALIGALVGGFAAVA